MGALILSGGRWGGLIWSPDLHLRAADFFSMCRPMVFWALSMSLSVTWPDDTQMFWNIKALLIKRGKNPHRYLYFFFTETGIDLRNPPWWQMVTMVEVQQFKDNSIRGYFEKWNWISKRLLTRSMFLQRCQFWIITRCARAGTLTR